MPEHSPAGDLPLSGMLQDMVLESSDVHNFLTGLSQLAANQLSPAGSEVLAAVILLRPRTKATVASSSEHAQKMDEIQHAFDDGPCLRAAREGTTYVVTDFRTDTRFGGYSAAIADHGLLSAVGIPIPLDGHAAAGLNLYATRPGAFDEEAVAEGEALAGEASRSLRMAVHIAHLTDTTAHLKEEMSSRTVIDVAAGIMMGQNRCSHDTAMMILKAASSGRHMKLKQVAATVVESLGQGLPRRNSRPVSGSRSLDATPGSPARAHASVWPRRYSDQEPVLRRCQPAGPVPVPIPSRNRAAKRPGAPSRARSRALPARSAPSRPQQLFPPANTDMPSPSQLPDLMP
jgi:hypothetical protein